MVQRCLYCSKWLSFRNAFRNEVINYDDPNNITYCHLSCYIRAEPEIFRQKAWEDVEGQWYNTVHSDAYNTVDSTADTDSQFKWMSFIKT